MRKSMLDMVQSLMTRASRAGAFGLALAGCSLVPSNMPSFGLLTQPDDASLTVDSDPPGAVASASNGAICRTPCALSVPTTDAFTVTYTLDGYLPQTISVRPIPVEKTALIDMTQARLEPNPVLAQLQPAPPPPVKRRQRP